MFRMCNLVDKNRKIKFALRILTTHNNTESITVFIVIL